VDAFIGIVSPLLLPNLSKEQHTRARRSGYEIDVVAVQGQITAVLLHAADDFQIIFWFLQQIVNKSCQLGVCK
jgi:hypothetical protein